MISIKRKVSNPMTIIAIFAFISETSAAVSLPFLDESEREIYIWFLISFPFYLLFLFFITLNFNYRSLYAPSDFDKDDHFLKAFEETIHDQNNDRPTARPGNVPDPPLASDFATPPWIEHHIHLPKPFNTLRVFDVREMNHKVQFEQLRDALPKPGKHSGKYMIFLTDVVSDPLLRDAIFNTVRQNRKNTPTMLYIIYNVSMQVTTIL